MAYLLSLFSQYMIREDILFGSSAINMWYNSNVKLRIGKTAETFFEGGARNIPEVFPER